VLIIIISALNKNLYQLLPQLTFSIIRILSIDFKEGLFELLANIIDEDANRSLTQDQMEAARFVEKCKWKKAPSALGRNLGTLWTCKTTSKS